MYVDLIGELGSLALEGLGGCSFVLHSWEL